MLCRFVVFVVLVFFSLAGTIQAGDSNVDASLPQRPEWMFSGKLPSGRSGLLGMGESLQSALLHGLSQLKMDKTRGTTVGDVKEEFRKIRIGKDLVFQKHSLSHLKKVGVEASTSLSYRDSDCKYVIMEEEQDQNGEYSATMTVTFTGGDTCNFGSIVSYLNDAGIEICAQRQDENANVHVLLCVDGKATTRDK